MIFRRYRAVVTPEAASTSWSLFPMLAENVAKFREFSHPRKARAIRQDQVVF
jgi:hypothetical protein